MALDSKAVLAIDGYLEPEIPSIEHRYGIYRKWRDTIDQHEGGYDNFTKGYQRFGFNVRNDGELVYREWAPNAREAYLMGDFS
jgi:1,4-alpha-glucan branching enzyme